MSSAPDREFAAAAKTWNLEPLYADLAGAKGKSLTPVEKLYLRGLLCGFSPNEIAEQCQVAADTVRNYLSKGLYRYIEEALLRRSQEVGKLDWSRVGILLERAGYRRLEDGPTPPVAAIAIAPPQGHGKQIYSCDHKPTLAQFYGRSAELAQLTHWCLDEVCRLISVVGIGGIGKTSLLAVFVEAVQEDFQIVIWRSLRQAPSLSNLCRDILPLMLRQPQYVLPTGDSGVATLMEVLHSQRCLLVLDDVQGILQDGELAGQFSPGYEAYEDWFRRLGETDHRSCVVLAGWEKLRTIAMLEGQTQPVRSLVLAGLGTEARHLLAERDLADQPLWDELIRPYRGHPLAIKIIATTICDLFGGSVQAFLDQNTLYLGDFSYLIHQQVQRLSPVEQVVLTQLSQMSEPLTLTALRQALLSDLSGSTLLQTLESLQRRSLIEIGQRRGENQVVMLPTVQKFIRSQRQSL